MQTVPKFLYGTSREVERNWNSVKKTIWNDDDWSALEEANVIEVPQPNTCKVIVSQMGEYRYKTPEILTYVIPENSFANIHERREHWHKHAVLTWKGLQYFWFALSLSSNSFKGCDFYGDIENGKEFVYEGIAYSKASFYRKWFELYLPWLDEIAALSPRCFSVYDRNRYVLESPANFTTIWHVALKAEICNYIDQLLQQRTFSELVERLVTDGIVRRTEHGYRLP